MVSDAVPGLPDVEPAPEPEGCPYCGQPVAESDEHCPQCKQLLTVRALKRTEFPARVWLLVATWLVQALADVADGVLVIIALMTLAGFAGSTLGANYIFTYVAGAAFASYTPASDLLRMAIIFIAFDVIAAAWSLVVAIVLPWRRSAALAVALFVAALHVVVAISSFAVGMTSLWIGLGRLALGLFLGFFLLEAQGDFVWESVRQRLELDRGAKSSMDYYNWAMPTMRSANMAAQRNIFVPPCASVPTRPISASSLNRLTRVCHRATRVWYNPCCAFRVSLRNTPACWQRTLAHKYHSLSTPQGECSWLTLVSKDWRV
jgi:hypothetical protein